METGPAEAVGAAGAVGVGAVEAGMVGEGAVEEGAAASLFPSL